MPFLVLAVVAGIVFVQEGQRRIPVQYAKRVIGRRMTEGGQTYLPLRVNMAGVIPVIFAASIMAFPPTVGQLVKTHWGSSCRTSSRPTAGTTSSASRCSSSIFTYFYTAVTFNPVDQADNLKKYGGFIPGVRPGPPDRRIPRPHPRPPDVPRRAVPRRRRRAAGDPVRAHPPELPVRRHLDPDRDRRRARNDEAARGAADDAKLRGLPEVALAVALAAATSRRPPGDSSLAEATRVVASPPRGSAPRAGRLPRSCPS